MITLGSLAFQVLQACKLTESWRRRQISNFHYIMALNVIAGRSFNDISQYPVFPWVLADYTSRELDLNNPASFRDLGKPVGALNERRRRLFLERYAFRISAVVVTTCAFFLWLRHIEEATSVIDLIRPLVFSSPVLADTHRSRMT